MSATVRINDAAFKAMANGPELHAACTAAAEKAKAIAVGLAQEFRVTGEYADSFEVTDETVDWHGEYPGPRAAGRLTNTAPYAAAVEWGHEGREDEPGQSAHHVLARTLDALGGAE